MTKIFEVQRRRTAAAMLNIAVDRMGDESFPPQKLALNGTWAAATIPPACSGRVDSRALKSRFHGKGTEWIPFYDDIR